MDTPLNHRRYPWLAAFLSLLLPGLGQLYCGSIVKCLWLAGSTTAIGLFSLLALVPMFPSRGVFIIGFQAIALLIYGFSVVDAYLMARQTREDYKLRDYNRWYIYLLLYLAVSGGPIFSGLYVRDHLLQPFKVPSVSMYPAIWPGDRLVAAKNAYVDKDPAVGDIVIFHNPNDRRVLFIKRVVAVGGDSVEIRDGELYINNIRLKRDEATAPAVIPGEVKPDGTYFDEWNRDAKYRIVLSPNASPATRSFPKTTIPKNYCFVLGDNRDESADSRVFGAIPIVGIIGKASFIYAPGQDWSRFGSIR